MLKLRIKNLKLKISRTALSAFLLSLVGDVLFAQDTVEILPSAPYDRLIIYETLAIFWLGIIGLIVIIRMKLKEVERTQKMGLDREEKDIPLLD